MRLLKREAGGDVVLIQCPQGSIPVYATLSHTWGTEEVSLQDLESGLGKSKAGWKKIEFCVAQAAADGLQYVWVDTCCIDKKDAVELSAAINSMFSWYKKAARCYVYLSDVSSTPGSGEQLVQDSPPWESAFRRSRWWTRGWTLQELLAPMFVDFFSSDGKRLGSRLSLEALVHEVTGISRNALQNSSLSDFSIDERMSWAAQRHTTLEEDQAYCLLGIFDVSMPLIYGEGSEKARRRLQEEIHKSYKGAPRTDLSASQVMTAKEGRKGSMFEQFAVGFDLSALPEAARFVAREAELAEMHQLLYGHSSRSIVVLHGLGGIGKTQLSITYARRHKEKYTAIFWLNASDEDSLKSSFRDIIQQVLRDQPSAATLAGVDLDGDLDKVVNTAKAWLDLRNNTRWLMVYDNYDNPKTPDNSDPLAVDIRRFLPRADHGSIIITTRSSQVRQGQRLHIQKLSEIQQGLKILSNTSGRERIETDPAAIELVKELDGLPLALSTAGAYLENVTTSFPDYLRLYRSSWLKLQTTSPRLSSYEDRSLYTTWQITYQRIRQQNPAAAKLLELWAYFDRQDVWFELLQKGGSTEEGWIKELTEDEVVFNEAIRLLCSYGLVDIDSSSQQQFGSSKYSMHSCVHKWTVFVLNQEWNKSLARLALTCVASGLPSQSENNWWLTERRLLPHGSRLEKAILRNKAAYEGMEQAFNKLGNLFVDQYKLTEAETMYHTALKGWEESFGPESRTALAVRLSLCSVYMRQGQLLKAEEMSIRTLEGYTEILGPDHTSTTHSVHVLAIIRIEQGRLSEAEAMSRRVIQNYTREFGPKHENVLQCMELLGYLHAEQGKLAESESMYSRVVQDSTETLGPKHTWTLRCLIRFAGLRTEQGRLTESESMCNQVLQDCEATFGPKHELALSAGYSLAWVYIYQGKLSAAEAILLRTQRDYEEIYGPQHRLVYGANVSLGETYLRQGRLSEAETKLIGAAQGFKEGLGPGHRDTLFATCTLGNSYRLQQKFAEADDMIRRALEGFKETVGPTHRWTSETANNLGCLLADQGNFAAAETWFTSALLGYEARGSADSYVPALYTTLNLGTLFTQTNQPEKARAMYMRALSGFTASRGPSSEICGEIQTRIQSLGSPIGNPVFY